MLQSQRVVPAEREAVQRVVNALSQPADPVRIMARVGALLEPYYDKGTPQSIREIEMEDWADALGKYPYWAIERAAKWWKSEGNPQRRKRPLEGDIAARCKVELMAVRAAEIRERGGWRGNFMSHEERGEPCSPEAASEILARAGFTAKTFGQEAAE
uniref:Uncharacterized protein n=1 Tax=Alloyangia mangrovi TaxID=1779329 RepID=A0A2A3K2R9_9RHOB